MERKIGEIFEYDGDWYQCLESRGCSSCDFYELLNCSVKFNIVGECVNRFRSDGKPVVFKKLEKVGEPLKINGKIYQGLISPYGFNNCSMCAFRNISCKDVISCYDDYIFIEIETKQQTKEDREEGKLDPHMEKVIDEATQKMGEEIDRQIEANINKQRMKPFNLEAAKEGKPVCTRDGRSARIICFDAKGAHPIIALVTDGTQESPYNYTEKGYHYIEDVETMADLMMLPEKKSGWANIVKGNDGCSHMGRGIFQSKEAAEDAIKAFSSKLIDTIKVEWYE